MADALSKIPDDDIMARAAEIQRQRDEATTAARIASDEAVREAMKMPEAGTWFAKIEAANESKSGSDLELNYLVDMFRRVRAKYLG
jgi:hypothetical protein